jgi:hypothetical protein
MKINDYLVTATELNEMAVTFGYSTKSGIANSNKAVTKSEASSAYYLDENASPFSTYTSNRCPRYQDFVCAPSGLTISVSTISVNDLSPITPIYNSNYGYLFKINSTVPAQNLGPVTFDITLPSNITLVAFRFVYYNGNPVPLPTSNYYTVDIFNTTTGQVRITLLKPTTTEYSIAFNARANEQFGTFSATGYASGLWCTNTVTASATNSYQLVVPNVAVSKTVSSGTQNGCFTSKLYTITITNSGGPLIGGSFTDTLPVGLILGAFTAIYYDGKQIGPCTGTIFDPCPPNQLPLPTSDYYNVVTWQSGTNGGQMVVDFFKEVGNGHYYTVYVVAINTGATASYTNTANYTNGTYLAGGSNTSTYTTYASTTYYEVQGCAAFDYAYTTIVPLGLNNRYVLPSNGAFYTYTGASTTQCTVPPSYNASLQQTSFYGCCDSTPNWQNNGSYNCYSTCDLYYVQQDINPCSATYNQTRQGSVAAYNSTSCGGCCGQSTSANWQNTGGYACYSTCNLYNIERDINPCSPTYTQTRQGSLYQSNSTSCGGCCGQSTSANWVDNGATFCSGCNLYQPQIDNNPCSATYNQTRNVNLGVSSTCGTWNTTFYCVGFDYYSKEVNSCTGAERNVTLVEANSPNCGYVPPPTCRIYNIIAGSSSGVTGTYQGCASGSTTSFSFPGGPGIVGQVCARLGTVSVSGGTSSNTGTSCT